MQAIFVRNIVHVQSIKSLMALQIALHISLVYLDAEMGCLKWNSLERKLLIF